MPSNSSKTIELPSTSKTNNISNCGDEHFREIVFDFIERIEREISMYENDGASISASDFKQIELQIQAKRVEKVLKLCVNKIRLIFIVSHLIEHQRGHFKLLLAETDAEFMERFAEKWLTSMPDSSNQEFNADLYDCLTIADRADSKWNIQTISNSGQNIMLLLTELSQIARYRIEMSASTEMAKQKVLHHLWAINTKHMRKINQIRREIEEDRIKVSGFSTEKQREIERLEFEKQRLTHKNSMALNRLIIESNKAMTEICEIGKCHQAATTEAVMRAKEMFDTLRKNDICEENEAIQKKIDLEHQLKDFLEVYDQEIGARSLKLRDCNHTLKSETNTLTEWKEKYKVQEVLYNQIQADREAEEEKRREEKILLFMMNRVARIIQRSYRRILAIRKAKKKGKGKKGGKSKK